MSVQRTLFDDDGESARARRDEALDRVATNAGDWMPAALQVLARRPCPGDFTGEELRLHLVAAGCPEPHHCNAWGALINQAVRLKIIRATGRYRKMKLPRSHARATPVYEWQ